MLQLVVVMRLGPSLAKANGIKVQLFMLPSRWLLHTEVLGSNTPYPLMSHEESARETANYWKQTNKKKRRAPHPFKAS